MGDGEIDSISFISVHTYNYTFLQYEYDFGILVYDRSL